MKTKVYTKRTSKLFTRLMALIMVISFSMCQEEAIEWEPDVNELQITEYIERNPELYSEFLEALKISKLDNLLYARGPYTLFLPDNDAMNAYYQEKGVAGINGFDSVFVKRFVLNHLLAIEIYSNNIGLGSLPDTNTIGDFLVSEFDGSDIIINKRSKIINRDVVAANGVIHVLDKAIDPVTKSVYEILSEHPGFSVFFQGLERAGLRDTLERIYIPFGNIDARCRYSILAVPDSIYAKASINSVDDLIALFDDGNGGLTNTTNGFNKYMVYHCLSGTYFMSDFESEIYYIITRENYVNFKVGEDFRINENSETEEFTTFIVPESNVPAKNGVIHAVNGLLPDISAVLEPYIFQMTDFPDIKNQECYLSYIKNFGDGENGFAKIKWSGDYMQYYYKADQSYMDHDCISMSEGHWWLEITVPKISKGKYSISGHFKTGENRANVVVYIDGEKVEEILPLNDSFNFVELPIKEYVEWTETTEHTFRMVTVTPGIIYWDWLKFTPIVE